MKTKTLLLTAFLAAGSIASTDAAHAKSSAHKGGHEQYYVRAEGGLSMPSKAKVKYSDFKNGATIDTPARTVKQKSKNSYTFGLSGGYTFNEFFRADATLGYKEYKYKAESVGLSKVKAFSLMANGYLEAHNDTIFTPYLLAGFGIGRLDPKLANGQITDAAGNKDNATFKSKKSNNFVWNLGAGVRAKVIDSTDVDLTYKYVTLGDAKFNGTSIDKGTNTSYTSSGKAKSLKGHEILAGVMFRF